MGPDLTGGNWQWGNGSLAAIAATIDKGVVKPKHADGAMPPRGGAPLTDADVKAVAAYVWALSHQHATAGRAPHPEAARVPSRAVTRATLVGATLGHAGASG